MNFIREEGDVIIIGALTSHDEIYKSSIIRNAVPFLSEASFSVGSPQIRNRGTVGGNICNASPAADSVPPLIALDADVKIESIRGVRLVPLKSVYVKANQNNLAPDEIITEIRFKTLPLGSRTAFIKLGRRKALAISRINVAVAAKIDDEGKVSDVRIYPGCIFGMPERVTAAEDVLVGKCPTEELINAAALKVSEEMINKTGIRWSTEYKKPAVEALIRRGLKEVLGVE
jgi:carbon-monoxide dehydrogenase medium subunit/xanthine dehydrogenase FAD-binding subunit